MVMLKKPPSHSWWFESHNSPKRSPWLEATILELDEKTKSMLRLIEQDADSFAQRAEMYYKKRPELINMVEDFYRTHRSLAERYDQLKLETGTRLLAYPFASAFSIKSLNYKLSNLNYKPTDTSSDCFDDEESEVDDPEQEVTQVNDDNVEVEEVSSDEDGENEIWELKEEIKRLEEQNRLQKAEIEQRNEEKREAIRQLTLALDILKQENISLRKSIAGESRKSSVFDFSKMKSLIPGRLFGGNPKFHTSIVAL